MQGWLPRLNLEATAHADVLRRCGVDANDLPFFEEMPYLAMPHSGNPL